MTPEDLQGIRNLILPSGGTYRLDFNGTLYLA
jgi:hypothetical protein